MKKTKKIPLKQEMTLGNFISFHRKKSGLSQLDLARIAGVGKTLVFDLEKGKATIQWDSLLKVALALNISIEFKSALNIPSYSIFPNEVIS